MSPAQEEELLKLRAAIIKMARDRVCLLSDSLRMSNLSLIRGEVGFDWLSYNGPGGPEGGRLVVRLRNGGTNPKGYWFALIFIPLGGQKVCSQAVWSLEELARPVITTWLDAVLQ